MKILEKLFGNVARVKLLRMFLFNPEVIYDRKDIARHAKVTSDAVRRELSMMRNIGFIKERTFYKSIPQKNGKSSSKKKRTRGWILDDRFPYLEALQSFLIHATSLKDSDILKKLNKSGRMNLVIVAGVFMQNLDSRIDILIVSNKIKRTQLEKTIKDIEAELGKELRYAVFDINDFKYRMNIHDKLIRDVFDYPHKILVDKIGVSESL